MFKEKMHKVNYSIEMESKISNFEFLKKWEGWRIRVVIMIHVFFLVITILFLSTGSSWAVISISSIEDLQKIGNDPGYPLNEEYELTQNINAGDTINWNSGSGFAPIGTESNPFTGKFDGKGYKITGLYINRPSTNNIGLFGYTNSDSEVKNLGIENCWIVGNNHVGGLVGINHGSVSNCYSTGLVKGNWYVGGLVGYKMNGNMTNSYSRCSVWGSESYIGGLIGYNVYEVSSCYSTGPVIGNLYVGGLIGWNNSMVLNCYSMGRVLGNDQVGGLVGNNDNGMLWNCYSIGAVTSNGIMGGLIGWNNSGMCLNCYWDVETSGHRRSNDGEGKTTLEMKQQATYKDWDFTNIWAIEENVSYPYLKALGPNEEPEPPQTVQINNIEELQKIGNDPGYPWWWNYELTQDFDANETLNWDGGKGFKPIRLTGKLDGKGHKISNLYINREEEDSVGFISVLGLYGEVENLGVENCYIVGRYAVGGLVARNYGCTIMNCYTTGSVRGSECVGGLIGTNGNWGNPGGIVSNCYSTCEVLSSGNYVGGLVGKNGDYNMVSNCYSTGSVSGKDYVGGLVGINSPLDIPWDNPEGVVSNCYSKGAVSGNLYVGGLVGYNANSGIVSNCYSTGAVSGKGYVGGLAGENNSMILNCYSIGSVSGDDGFVGGLVSFNFSGTVSNCYWDIETSGKNTSGGGTGKTTVEMKQQATYTGWDFINTWKIIEPCSYPWLSLLPNPNITAVPGVLNLSRAEAELVIENSCLVIGEVIEQCSNTVPIGHVINQYPEGGIIVELGSSIFIVLSIGPCFGGEGEGIVEGIHEGTEEGALEGIVEGIHEGAEEGVSEGTVEGTHEGTEEGVSEGTVEGTIDGEGGQEGYTEGMKEGIGEGQEGTKEGNREGEGREEINIDCGCNSKVMGEEWWKYLLDFVLVGLLISLMSGMDKRQKRKK